MVKQPTILHQEDRRDSFLIQCLQIAKSYPPGQQVFRDANLEVRRGELVFLLGGGGSGKSTLIRLLLGLEPLSQGHILFEGRDMQRLPRKEILFFRRCTGVVFQDFKLIKNSTVFENVALPLEIADREHFYIRRKVHGILRLIGLDHKMDMPCLHLSGGEQQLVALARAIINDPILLLADEPTGCLDETPLDSAMELIERIHAQGATVIVSTRDRSLAEKIPESRVVAIQQGGFVESNALASSISSGLA